MGQVRHHHWGHTYPGLGAILGGLEGWGMGERAMSRKTSFLFTFLSCTTHAPEGEPVGKLSTVLFTGDRSSRLSRLTARRIWQLDFSLPRGMLTQETQGRLTVFILLGRFNRIEGWVMPPDLLTYRQQKSRLLLHSGRTPRVVSEA